MLHNHDQNYQVFLAKDARHDGRLFAAVKTTGIYCRPICPARTPKIENITFFPTAAGAQQAGFRPCLRCRPGTAPDTPAWRGTAASVGRALRLIEEGALDEGGVEQLAMRLGLGGRQLRRLFLQHLGASPVAVAQAKRVHLAKQLLHESSLPMTQVALASGFGSIRRFNEVFQGLFQRPPAQIRRALTEVPYFSGSALALKLRFRAPYDWDNVMSFLSARLYYGVENIKDGQYARSFEFDDHIGFVRVGRGGANWLNVEIQTPNLVVVPKVIGAVRHSFDLGGDPQLMSDYLSQDEWLAPLMGARPGLRVPCSWSGFEGVVRAVLGQQITVKAAIALGNLLVEALGRKMELGAGLDLLVNKLFPTARAVAESDLSFLPMPNARRETLRAVAQLFVEDPSLLNGDVASVRARLASVKGIGPWTLDYVALRVLGDVDSFPSGDVALVKAYSILAGEKVTTAQLEGLSQSWRPWRAYAAQHLWSSL